MKEVDVRGFSCPIPVVKTKKAMDENPDEVLTILVETETSKENVMRLAKHNNYEVSIELAGDNEYRLTLAPKN